MMTPLEKEKLEVLNGDRPNNKEGAAVRLAQVRQLVSNLPVTPSGNAATDIANLYAAINALRIAVM